VFIIRTAIIFEYIIYNLYLIVLFIIKTTFSKRRGNHLSIAKNIDKLKSKPGRPKKCIPIN